MNIQPIAVFVCAFALFSPAFTDLLFTLDFESNNVGDTYTTDSGAVSQNDLVKESPDQFTHANNTGSWSATVTAQKQLNFTATSQASGGGLQIMAPQPTPSSPETWYIQFDYTPVETTSGILFVNFLNASGQNMLGHANNGTFYPHQFIAAGEERLVVGNTYTLRIEIDSGTNTVRTYRDGVEVENPLNAVDTTSFGGIKIGFIQDDPPAKDFILDNIIGGTKDLESAPSAFMLLGMSFLRYF